MIEKAIVSPCSSCKNKLDRPDNGKPACPRLMWKRMADDMQQRGQDIPEALGPALLTGTEGTDQEGTSALLNPVYSDDNHHILVWAAALKDNSGQYDQDGNLISPTILDPAFDTTYIQCKSLPFSVGCTEAEYFMNGAYREGDLLQISMEWEGNQLSTADGQVTDFDPVKVAGCARKIDFPYHFNRQPVQQDLVPRGT